MEEEVWKDITGYEGLYQVSNLGRVKSLAREVFTGVYMRQIPETIKISQKHSSGNYRSIVLSKEGKKTPRLIHRLVAEAFIPNPNNKPEIDHKDGDPTNNNSNNLRWATRKENNNFPIHKHRVSESKKGCKSSQCGKFGKLHHNSIPVVRISFNGVVAEYECLMAAARDGFNLNAVWNCCNGRVKTHKGYRWMYKSDYSLLNT